MLVSVQVGWGVSKDRLVTVLPNMEGIINSRIEGDVVSSVNHLGEAKDVGDVIRIIVNFAESWDLSFEVKSMGASISVHGYGQLGGANVSYKVWVDDYAIYAGARV